MIGTIALIGAISTFWIATQHHELFEKKDDYKTHEDDGEDDGDDET